MKSPPKPTKRRITITGTPADVKKMLAVAQKVEPTIYRKDRLGPEKVLLWYRSDTTTNDLLTAIKKSAKVDKLIPPKHKPKKDVVEHIESSEIKD